MNDEIMRGVGLPWKARDNELLFEDGCIVGQFFSVDSGTDGGFDAKRCAYAARAANSFPKLVKALHGLIAECEYSASSGLPFNATWIQLSDAKSALDAATKKKGEEQ